MYDLSGKVALITGAGGELGIGRAICQRLASEGPYEPRAAAELPPGTGSVCANAAPLQG